MKKSICILIMLSFIGIANSQWYFNFNTGYSFTTHPDIRQNRVITNDTIKLFRIKFPYGNGLNTSFGAGYIFEHNFFAEIRAITTFFSGSRSDNNWKEYFRREYLKLHLTGLNGNVVIRNSIIQVTPLIGYSINTGKVRPFFSAGLNFLYMKSRYTNDYTYRYFSETLGVYFEDTHVERETHGKIALGFRGNVGILYPLGESMLLTADVTAVNSMYHFKKPVTLSFKVNGVEEVNETEEDLNEYSVDFSNLGFNIGIRYAF